MHRLRLILVLLAALVCPRPAAADPLSAAPAWLAADTPVRVRLLQPLKSNHERTGDRIRLATMEDLLAPDRSVIVPKGTPVFGTITHANGRGMLGKPGRLSFTIDFIQATPEVRIPLRAAPNSLRGRDNAGIAIVPAVVLLGPAWLFIHGREVSVPDGKEYTLLVDQRTLIPGVAPVPVAAAPPAVVAPPVLAAAGIAPGAAPRPDLAHLSQIHLKNGDTITGSIATQKDGAYFVITELGQVTIDREMIAFISQKPLPNDTDANGKRPQEVDAGARRKPLGACVKPCPSSLFLPRRERRSQFLQRRRLPLGRAHQPVDRLGDDDERCRLLRRLPLQRRPNPAQRPRHVGEAAWLVRRECRRQPIQRCHDLGLGRRQPLQRAPISAFRSSSVNASPLSVPASV